MWHVHKYSSYPTTIEMPFKSSPKLAPNLSSFREPHQDYTTTLLTPTHCSVRNTHILLVMDYVIRYDMLCASKSLLLLVSNLSSSCCLDTLYSRFAAFQPHGTKVDFHFLSQTRCPAPVQCRLFMTLFASLPPSSGECPAKNPHMCS